MVDMKKVEPKVGLPYAAPPLSEKWVASMAKKNFITYININLIGVTVGVFSARIFHLYSTMSGLVLGLLFAFVTHKAMLFLKKKNNIATGVMKRNEEILESVNEYTGDSLLSSLVIFTVISKDSLDIYNKPVKESLSIIRNWCRSNKLTADCSSGHSPLCRHYNPTFYKWLTETI